MQRYFIIYKPYLVLSQFTKQNERHTTLRDVFDVPDDVYAVGRLDNDSEGLLILTNDKQLNNRLLHPSFGHEREYWVQVDGLITSQAVEKMKRGVDINVEGKTYRTQPCLVHIMEQVPGVAERNPPVRFRKTVPTSWISIALTEGKNRQVRKMTAAAGFPTLRLIRYRIVGITLDGMQPGEMIELPKETVYGKLFNDPRNR